VLPCPLNERGETVNRDLYKVKRDVFVRKAIVPAALIFPAKHGRSNGNIAGT
jgi:hypothetical protein